MKFIKMKKTLAVILTASSLFGGATTIANAMGSENIHEEIEARWENRLHFNGILNAFNSITTRSFTPLRFPATVSWQTASHGDYWATVEVWRNGRWEVLFRDAWTAASTSGVRNKSFTIPRSSLQHRVRFGGSMTTIMNGLIVY